MENRIYVAPVVEVQTIVVEMGFQASGSNDGGGIFAPEWG